ncbi:hypothetical protein D1872_284510 [compost metagenome]
MQYGINNKIVQRALQQLLVNRHINFGNSGFEPKIIMSGPGIIGHIGHDTPHVLDKLSFDQLQRHLLPFQPKGQAQIPDEFLHMAGLRLDFGDKLRLLP